MAKAKTVSSNEYPKMLYQEGGTEDIHGGKFKTLIVANFEEEAAAIENNWHLTTDDARQVEIAPTVGTWGKS